MPVMSSLASLPASLSGALPHDHTSDWRATPARVCRRNRDRLGDRRRSDANRVAGPAAAEVRPEADYMRVDAYTTTKGGVPIDDLRRGG